MTNREKRKTVSGVVVTWWGALHGREDKDTRKWIEGDRAGRAELRRCAMPMEALLVPATHRLVKSVAAKTFYDPINESLLPIAVVLASVRPRDDWQNFSGVSFARVLGQTPDGDAPTQDNSRQRLSPLRFDALVKTLRAENPIDSIRALRRAVAITDKAGFNVRWLIEDLLDFDDDVQRRWIYDYWQTFEPQPDEIDKITETENA